MAITYEAIATVTVGSGGAAGIDFTSIPQTYTDLVVLISGRSNRDNSPQDVISIGINGSYTNMSGFRLGSSGSTVFAGGGGIDYFGVGAGDTGTANTFGNALIYIPNYTSSNNKSISIDQVSENNATQALAGLTAGLWSNSSAITNIALIPTTAGNFSEYSTATLYGIKNS